MKKCSKNVSMVNITLPFFSAVQVSNAERYVFINIHTDSCKYFQNMVTLVYVRIFQILLTHWEKCLQRDSYLQLTDWLLYTLELYVPFSYKKEIQTNLQFLISEWTISQKTSTLIVIILNKGAVGLLPEKNGYVVYQNNLLFDIFLIQVWIIRILFCVSKIQKFLCWLWENLLSWDRFFRNLLLSLVPSIIAFEIFFFINWLLAFSSIFIKYPYTNIK